MDILALLKEQPQIEFGLAGKNDIINKGTWFHTSGAMCLCGLVSVGRAEPRGGYGRSPESYLHFAATVGIEHISRNRMPRKHRG